MCRLLGVVGREPVPVRLHLVEAPWSLLRMSLRGEKGPHRDGFGYAAFREPGVPPVVRRWGAEALAAIPEGFPGDLGMRARLLIAHARKASPEYGARTAAEAHPFLADGIVLAHNGTIRDAHRLSGEPGTDSRKLAHWLARAWSPRTPGALARALGELLGLISDYTAVNLLLSEGRHLYAFCCYTREPDYYTLWYQIGPEAAVVASEPPPDGDGWDRLPNRGLLIVSPDLGIEGTVL